MQQYLLPIEPVRRVWTVAELNRRLRTLFDDHFGELWVSGEVSGTRMAGSGHWYFTLKDGDSQIKCACFRMAARYLRFKPQDGIVVIARGRMDVYEARGEYQLIVEHLEPQGHGALQLAFDQLKTKLAAEGLFAAERKRALPAFPRRIGIVTSLDGAVLSDMLTVLTRRCPGLHVRVWPALVQGEGSVEQVCRGVRWFSTSAWAEVVIVARGGGSLEDLWTFNEELVARAIAGCSVPVVSAIGHETDFTIADFVADLRAPTPSAAAELVAPQLERILDSVLGCQRRIESLTRFAVTSAARRLHELGADRAGASLHRRVGRSTQRIDELERCAAEHTSRMLRGVRERLSGIEARLLHQDLRLRLQAAGHRAQQLQHRLDVSIRRLVHAQGEHLRRATNQLAGSDLRKMSAERSRRLESLDRELRRTTQARLTGARSAFETLVAQIGQLSPARVLERGYAIVHTEGGVLVRQPEQAPSGTPIRIRVARGEFAARSE